MMRTNKLFYSPERSKHVEIGDHVEIGGDKAYVVSLGRKYVQVIFYPGQPSKGRMKIDPLSSSIRWTGTQHV